LRGNPTGDQNNKTLYRKSDKNSCGRTKKKYPAKKLESRDDCEGEERENVTMLNDPGA